MALCDFEIKNVPKIFHRFLIDDAKVLKERWDACNSCEFLTKKLKCEKCGCFMRLKTRIGRMKCPLDKWSSVC